jgi:glycosyltransferase involved in cell wall biosynthesis
MTAASRKPTVLIVGPTPPPHHGMTTITLALLGSATLQNAYRVVHLDNADRRGQDNMGRLDVGNVVLGVRHAARLAWLLVRHRPDVVYLPVAQNRWAYLRDAIFMTLAKLARVPVLTHLNGAGFRNFYESTDRITRWVVRTTSGWLAGAGVLGEGLRGIYDGLVPEERVFVVPNGIEDPGGLNLESNSNSNSNSNSYFDGVTVTYLGTLIRSKGVPALLEAAATFRGEGLGARFVFAGAWVSEAERVETQAEMDGLAVDGMVEFVGSVAGEAKRRVLEEADIFVLPTRYPPEGQPFAILEAMAAGVPVVSTPRGAIPDMVVDGETGVLVPEGDQAALEAALRRLVASPEERARLGAAARVRFLERFTEEAMTRRLIEVMDRVRARRG